MDKAKLDAILEASHEIEELRKDLEEAEMRLAQLVDQSATSPSRSATEEPFREPEDFRYVEEPEGATGKVLSFLQRHSRLAYGIDEVATNLQLKVTSVRSALYRLTQQEKIKRTSPGHFSYQGESGARAKKAASREIRQRAEGGKEREVLDQFMQSSPESIITPKTVSLRTGYSMQESKGLLEKLVQKGNVRRLRANQYRLIAEE